MLEKKGVSPEAASCPSADRVPLRRTELGHTKTFRRGQGGRAPALTRSQIEAARKLRAAGMSISELAEFFRCGRATIHRYVAGY